MKNQYEKTDPRNQYPKISPPEDSQSEPGLDAELTPAADHGQATYEGSGRLAGRKALITGGDSGIGHAVALAFAREGADVAIAYLPDEEADANRVVKEIEMAGRTAVALPGDLMEESYATKLVETAVNALGGLDIVVNNAGKQVSVEYLAELETAQLIETFTINVFAMFWVTKAALEYLKSGAVIINTSSIQAYEPSPDKIDYAATKAAIANFTKGMSAQLASKGIRVNAVAPGPIWTPLQPSHGQQKQDLPSFGHDTPLGRAGQPAELAGAYVFLASQESSYVTGQIIGVTGGKFIA